MSQDQEFHEFARSRTRHLYRSAWLLTGDHHRAEDLVQETLAQVYGRWTRPLARPIDNPVAYAQTTLVRVLISGRRRRSQHEMPTADLPSDLAPGADHDLRLTLLAALDQLEPLDRAVLVLRYLEDVSAQDTADRLGLTSGAVRNRCQRALSRLRTTLGPHLADLRLS